MASARDRTTEDIWREFSGPLRGFLLKRIAEPEDVEDVLQDVFVKLHTRIDTLRDGERIAPWLYRVARNTLIDYYRERRPVVGLPDDLAVDDEPDESDAERHIAASLTSMVDQLPESYRQAVTLADLQAVPQPEIAERLGLSVSGAKSRVQRGRALLREALLDCCHFEFDRRGGLIDYTPRPDCCRHCAQ